MTDEQKEDLQFWFYTRTFVDHQDFTTALKGSADEVSVPYDLALDYLRQDGRVVQSQGNWVLRQFETEEADPKGVYVDIEWMLQILHRAGLEGEKLWGALGSIYKIPLEVARDEAANIKIVEGE